MKKPLIPILFPLCDNKGKFLRPYDLFKSRKFCLTYLLIVFSIAFFLGFGHWGGHRCESLIEQLACSSSIWPNKLFSKPHEFFISFFTSPYIHNDLPHLKLVLFGFFLFGQSFEAWTNSKSTFVLFFSSIAFTCILMGLFINLGYFLNSDSEFFSSAMNRSFIGGSVGMFGLFGGLSNYSEKTWFIALFMISFEIWNIFVNGITNYISMGHLISFFFGLSFWNYCMKRGILIHTDSIEMTT